MTIETLKITDLTPDPANARKHSPRNLDAIKSSLQRFGQQKPIVIDSRGIVRAGNGTLMAAKSLGWTEINAVRSDLPAGELTAFGIVDNRSAELAEWDTEVLAGFLADDALGDLGFNDDEISKMLGDASGDGLDDKPAATLGDEKWLVVVTCRDESDQVKCLEEIGAMGRDCRALVG